MCPTILISPEIRELFTVISNEVAWLNTIWELSIQLYGSNDEHYEIMNTSAPLFFSIIEYVLFDELVMIFNRCIDKPHIFRNENASFEQLIDRIDEDNNTNLVRTLRTKLETLRTTYSSFKIYRHKIVAHKDLLIALNKGADIVPGITRQEIEAAIKDITDFINEFSVNVFGTEQIYKPFLTGYGDGEALLQLLKRVDYLSAE
jgi:hypothetical protein